MALRVRRAVLVMILGNPNVSHTRLDDQGTDVYHVAWACGCAAQEHAGRANTFFLTACPRHVDDFALAEHEG